jgi:hypothetical protein
MDNLVECEVFCDWEEGDLVMNGADFGGYKMGLVLKLIIQLGWQFRFSRLWTNGVPLWPNYDRGCGYNGW